MPQAVAYPTTRPMGWEKVKALYLEGVGLNELSRLSGFTPSGIYRHIKDNAWDTERKRLQRDVRQSLLQRWAKDANTQATELNLLESRTMELAEVELRAMEADHTFVPSARLKALNQLQALLSAGIQSMRLLIGEATERTEATTLSAMIVQLQQSSEGRGGGGVRDVGLPQHKAPHPPSPSPTRSSRVKALPEFLGEK